MNNCSFDVAEDDIIDFDGANSDNDNVDSTLIKKILVQMKSEFNKDFNSRGVMVTNHIEDEKEDVKAEEPDEGEQNSETIDRKSDDCGIPLNEENLNILNNETASRDGTDSSLSVSNSSTLPVQIDDETETKKKKRGQRKGKHSSPVMSCEPTKKKIRRHSLFIDKPDQEVAVKRSSRRMSSKEFSGESVLQNAIALKEKSFSSLNALEEKQQRRSSRFSEDKAAKKIKTRSHTEVEVNGEISKSKKIPLDEDRRELENQFMFKGFPPRKSARSSKDSLHDAPDHKINKESIQHLPSISSESMSHCDTKPTSLDGNSRKKFRSQLLSKLSLCECESLTEMRPSKSSIQLFSMCRAVDMCDEKLYLCCNEISDDTVLLRTSKRTPYLQFCETHMQRLFSHNACPSCGVFCTQGFFNICTNKHIFHKDCSVTKDNSPVCPHCATQNFNLFKLRMENHKYPLFLPIQKPINREQMARITQQYKAKLYTAKTEEEMILTGNKVVLPNGNSITSQGIPGPEKDSLEDLLKLQFSDSDVRYTYRNLYQAAKVGDVEKIIAILSSGMNPNRDAGCLCALHAAAGAGYLTAVHVLRQAGANLDILDKGHFTPLMHAAFNGHNEVLKYLVKVGASPMTRGLEGMTALHFTAKLGNLEGCHLLLSPISVTDSFINTVDDGRWTPLVWAAENSHSKVARYLLEKRADPHVRDSEMNIALHWAAFAGNMDITEDLLNFGSNFNLSNIHGDTPLHIAARQGADDCVMLLLGRGARVDMMNKAGLTVKDCVVNPDSLCAAAIKLGASLQKMKQKQNSFPKLLSIDVSKGREREQIQCINAVDDDELPKNFIYITENCFTSNITIDRTITSLDPCKCDDMCYSGGCMCSKISGKCWYDNNGRLFGDFNFEDPPMLFECSEACNCDIFSCRNRVVQKGITSKLQMCKTKDKLWSVITLTQIPRGTFVCEYIGEIISDCEADTREDDSYLFDLDNRDIGESYCLDARKYGNISRFINHSCNPNLAPVRVFIGHRDLHFPRIAFFATRDILGYEELGYDYGEKFWAIKGKSFTCKCNEDSCRYSEERIQETLDKFNEKMEMEESFDCV